MAIQPKRKLRKRRLNMSFTNEDILLLAKAGFNAQQIAALNMVGAQPAPAPAPAAASALELSTWNGESFSILYPAKDTKLDSWSGPNELIAENSDMSIVLNARFSDEYKISQINDAIDYFKKKIDDYYDGVKGIKNVDAKTAIVHTTVTNDRDIWMFVIFNKDNAAVLGDFTYPVVKHAEGEALLSQIMSSVKFK